MFLIKNNEVIGKSYLITAIVNIFRDKQILGYTHQYGTAYILF